MDRRAFVTGLGAVLAAPLAVEAQQAGRLYRLGVLSPAPFTSLGLLVIALREMGYIAPPPKKITYVSFPDRADRTRINTGDSADRGRAVDGGGFVGAAGRRRGCARAVQRGSRVVRSDAVTTFPDAAALRTRRPQPAPLLERARLNGRVGIARDAHAGTPGPCALLRRHNLARGDSGR